MKISEHILQLRTFLDEHGDMDIVVMVRDGFFNDAAKKGLTKMPTLPRYPLAALEVHDGKCAVIGEVRSPGLCGYGIGYDACLKPYVGWKNGEPRCEKHLS